MWVRGDRGREVVVVLGAERRVDALVRRGGVEAERGHVVRPQLRDRRVRVRAEVLPHDSGDEAPARPDHFVQPRRVCRVTHSR